MWSSRLVRLNAQLLRSISQGAAAGALLVALAPLGISGTACGAERPDATPATLDVRFGVYFDAAGTQCSGTITPAAPTSVYIVAHSAPGTEIISGAEFRFTGLPATWSVYPVPNASILAIGNPFENGVSLAASNTQCAPEWSTFLMYSVLVIATDMASDVSFELTNRDPPTNPAFRCPLVMDCNLWAMHCVQTSPCFVNASAPAPCSVITGVEATTWSEVRQLYR